jgi:hypothetical protein
MERSALAGSDTNDAKEGSGQRFPPQAKPPAPTHPLQLGALATPSASARLAAPVMLRQMAPILGAVRQLYFDVVARPKR